MPWPWALVNDLMLSLLFDVSLCFTALEVWDCRSDDRNRAAHVCGREVSYEWWEMFPFHYSSTEAHADLHLSLFCPSVLTDLSSSKHSLSSLFRLCCLVDRSHTWEDETCAVHAYVVYCGYRNIDWLYSIYIVS